MKLADKIFRKRSFESSFHIKNGVIAQFQHIPLNCSKSFMANRTGDEK